MQILIDSPVSPYTSGLPLLFVVGLTAIKQAYEDYMRYREDKTENAKPGFRLFPSKIFPDFYFSLYRSQRGTSKRSMYEYSTR